jgi:hypothetical protein
LDSVFKVRSDHQNFSHRAAGGVGQVFTSPQPRKRGDRKKTVVLGLQTVILGLQTVIPVFQIKPDPYTLIKS